MDTDAVVVGIWHGRDLPLNTLAWQHALLTPEAQNLEPNAGAHLLPEAGAQRAL
jgi:hypothetical protein